MAGDPHANHVVDETLMDHVDNADVSLALGPLIQVFMMIFDAVGRVNQRNHPTNFSFDGIALVSEAHMTDYTQTIATLSPHLDTDYRAHVDWLCCVVPASLQVARSRRRGRQGHLITAVCELFVFMAVNMRAGRADVWEDFEIVGEDEVVIEEGGEEEAPDTDLCVHPEVEDQTDVDME